MNHALCEPRAKKRRRPALACLECHRRKVKCDRSSPCSQCMAHNSTCRYGEYEAARRHARLGQGQDGSPAPQIGAVNDIPPAVSSMTADSASTIEKAGESRISGLSNGEQHMANRAMGPEAESSSKTTPDGIHGALSKTRVFGHSHWISTTPFIKGLSTYSPITPQLHSRDSRSTTSIDALPNQLSETFSQCKQLARDIKRRLPSRSALPDDLHASLPIRDVLETSITMYFETYESCYRILDWGMFRREYDTYMERSSSNNKSSSPTTLLKILLLLCTIAPLHPDVSVRGTLRAHAPRWIHASQTWLSAPVEKDRLSLDGLQIHCLLLLARQVNRLGADLVWIAAGGLMRMAMQMGLHQDPESLGMQEKKSTAKKEVRRRLWYTILEMNVQAALDSGMVPLVGEDEFDTRVPDETETENETGSLGSYQNILAKSLPLRLEATRRINSLRETPSYEEVLQLGTRLREVYREATLHMASHSPQPSHSNRPIPRRTRSTFANSFLTHLLTRFLLCLHLPYAVQAPQAPLYTFSLQACLSSAQDLVSLLSDPLYNLLLTTGGGPFRDLITRGGLIIFADLVAQLQDEKSPFSRARNRARVQPLLEDARQVVSFARERLRNGDTNVKGYVGVRMVMAQVEALLRGEEEREMKEAVGVAARESLGESLEVLKRVREERGGGGCERGTEEGIGDGWTWTPGSGEESGGGGGWDFGMMGFDFDFDIDLDFGLGLGFGEGVV